MILNQYKKHGTCISRLRLALHHKIIINYLICIVTLINLQILFPLNEH